MNRSQAMPTRWWCSEHFLYSLRGLHCCFGVRNTYFVCTLWYKPSTDITYKNGRELSSWIAPNVRSIFSTIHIHSSCVLLISEVVAYFPTRRRKIWKPITASTSSDTSYCCTVRNNPTSFVRISVPKNLEPLHTLITNTPSNVKLQNNPQCCKKIVFFHRRGTPYNIYMYTYQKMGYFTLLSFVTRPSST